MLESIVFLRSIRCDFLAIVRLCRACGLNDAQTESILKQYGY